MTRCIFLNRLAASGPYPISTGRWIHRTCLIGAGVFLITALCACGTAAPGATPTSAPDASPVPSPIPATATAAPAEWAALLPPAAGIGDEASEAASRACEAAGLELRISSPTALVGEPHPPSLVINLSGEPLPEQAASELAQVPLVSTSIEATGGPAQLTKINGERVALHTAFAAGYTAAILSDNYRVGIVAPPADGGNRGIAQAFADGAVYYCGLCRPAYPPFEQYPIVLGLADSSDTSAAAAVAQELADRGVTVVYVAPTLLEGPLTQLLIERGMLLIRDSPLPLPPSTAIAATFRPGLELVLGQVISEALEGSPGPPRTVPLVIQPNEEILGAARLRLIQQVLDDLAEGFIAPSAP